MSPVIIIIRTSIREKIAIEVPTGVVAKYNTVAIIKIAVLFTKVAR
jgi:hypothetical protein